MPRYIQTSTVEDGPKKNQIASTAFRRSDASKKTGFYGQVCIKACLEIEKT